MRYFNRLLILIAVLVVASLIQMTMAALGAPSFITAVLMAATLTIGIYWIRST